MEKYIQKEIMSCEADIEEILDLLKILEASVEYNINTQYLTNFIKIIRQKMQDYSIKQESIYDNIWSCLN